MMQIVTVAERVHESEEAIEDEELAARCAATTLLITASVAADVQSLARRVHASSARAAAPFVHVSAAALPVESTTFRETCANLLDRAAGGNLLLTNVEQMPAIVQDRLIETLAQLQSAREPSAAVRLMAGTTASLCNCIAYGTFSERLFYRLNVIHIDIRKLPVGEGSA